MKKICFRCTKHIDDDSNHYAFQEMDEGKLVNIDYCHRECWDKFFESVGNTTEAMGILRGMKSKMQEMGVLPEEIVEIQ